MRHLWLLRRQTSKSEMAGENAKTRKSENAKGERHFYEEPRRPGELFSWLPPFLFSLYIVRISRFRSFASSRSLRIPSCLFFLAPVAFLCAALLPVTAS